MQLLDARADMIMFHDGNWDPEWVEWACDTAHAHGKPCFMRATGPRMGIVAAANAGIDVVHHARGASQQIMRDGVTPDGNAELDRFVHMDDAKARELVDRRCRSKILEAGAAGA